MTIDAFLVVWKNGCNVLEKVGHTVAGALVVKVE